MRVSVVTPDASFYDGEAKLVVLPAWDGEMGVLPGHAPLIGRLAHGVARVTPPGSEEAQRIAIYGGFVKIQDDVVSVLAGGAVSPPEGGGNPAQAKVDYEAARKALGEVKESGASPTDVAEAEEKANRARAYMDLLGGS